LLYVGLHRANGLNFSDADEYIQKKKFAAAFGFRGFSIPLHLTNVNVGYF